MKKSFLFSMAAIAGMLFASGCSQDMDSLYTGNGEETEVSFMLNAPAELGSRGAANGKQLKPGDGMTVGRVVCAVFDASGNEISHLRDTVTMTAKQAVFSTRLVKGQAYKIVCFAYSNAQAFNFADMKNISISYPQSCNDETLDAFAGQADIATAEWASGSVQKTITLKRPFAQLNIASSEADWTAATAQGYTTGLQSEVTVTNVYTAFNAYANEVTGSIAPSVTFNMASAVNDVVTVNGVDYHYVALGYFLAGDANSQQSLTDVTLTWQSAGTSVVHTYANVPVQRNYRTNILGAIFTNPVDVNIIVDETFVDEYTLDIWDGQTVTAVTPNAAGEYEISNGAQLAWIAQEVNKTPKPNSFQGKTVKLMKDIDLGNARWTPIGNLLSTPSTSFKGTFDGNGKTIRNMNAVDYTTNHATAGLFGSMVSATVKDLTIKDFSVSSTHYAAAICAYNEGDNSTVIKNCVVENGQIVSSPEMLNGEWDNGDKVGGIIGYTVNGNKVLGCTVKDVEIKGYRDMGGIVGCAGANCEVSGNTLENVTITVDAIHNYKNYTNPEQYNVGDYVGRKTGDNITIENNQGEARKIVPQAVAVVATAQELSDALNAFGAAGAGDNVVNITNDIILADGETWTPVNVNGYQGAGVITINGNGHTIKNLNAPLFLGGFAGNSGIVINDLTIANSVMTTTNTIGAGAFIESIDSQPLIKLINCHFVNSSLTSTCGSRVGGLIGWTAGYNNPNDGPVDTYVTITDCSVENCNITSNGSVGGIIGHAGNNPATFHTISNCTVKDCNLKAYDDGGWRVGVVVGTANVGEVTISNITSSGNTLAQYDDNTETSPKTQPEHSDLYGRFVPQGTGKLTIDGVEITE